MRQKRITKTPEEMAAIQAEILNFERLKSNKATKDQVKQIYVEFDKFKVRLKGKYGAFDSLLEAQTHRDNQPELV